jgi:hypothetical protein
MKSLDWATLLAGVAGLGLLTVGAAMIYRPAGFLVSGVGLLAWSYVVARAASKG